MKKPGLQRRTGLGFENYIPRDVPCGLLSGTLTRRICLREFFRILWHIEIDAHRIKMARIALTREVAIRKKWFGESKKNIAS